MKQSSGQGAPTQTMEIVMTTSESGKREFMPSGLAAGEIPADLAHGTRAAPSGNAELVERANKIADKLEDVWNEYCGEEAGTDTLKPDKLGMGSQFHSDLEDGWDLFNAMELLREFARLPAPSGVWISRECAEYCAAILSAETARYALSSRQQGKVARAKYFDELRTALAGKDG